MDELNKGKKVIYINVTTKVLPFKHENLKDVHVDDADLLSKSISEKTECDLMVIDDFTYFSVLVFLSSIWIYYAFACYDLMSRVSDFIQIIMLVLIPQLFAAVPKKRVKAAAAFALIALNAVLLYADITANLRPRPQVRRRCAGSAAAPCPP